ncbi:UDP-N-acetylmuramoylalanine-D-glutamate ligase MurD protein [Dioscorea alata]|uniref:UDP-N-acetylmuramoylalanine-D-glutamate ligase MurD protein n=1 Tax=Dioscorea alata TaxID=55571 RepID=A0ACB7UIZ2_DIOAL|nr:UDP-N-acetylmuramoylalanine-D-glutamate ligase MurD protein [Dioscorea alata]
MAVSAFALSTLSSSPLRVRSFKEDLQGQRVAVVGLGNSGWAAVDLALARGASVLAIDKNEQFMPLENDTQFSGNACLQTILGHCDTSLLANADRIVVSPGVSLEEFGLSTLLQSGRRVMSELDFASELLPENIKILAITGTNGKSTVTSFAGQMLHNLGIEAFVGGNFGTPLSKAAKQCLEAPTQRQPYQVAVVEVSSYQMEIPNQHFSPSVAVVLNLTPDHLERHKTMENYALVKCSLFSHMKDGRLAVLPQGNDFINDAFGKKARECNVAWIGDLPGIKVDTAAKVATFKFPSSELVTNLQLGTLKAMGTHNFINAAVAAFSVLGLDVGIDNDSIHNTIESLTLLPHRMQIVCRDAHGVTWVDDSKATNVESTLTGLMGLKEHKLVVLLGGLAKVMSGNVSNGFEKLVELLNDHRGVITFGSSGEMIYETLCDSGISIPCVRATNLEGAVNCARSMARSGDTILLSPGCASFDEFRNFEQRGQVFQKLAFSS